jgi:hypothetical protein
MMKLTLGCILLPQVLVLTVTQKAATLRGELQGRVNMSYNMGTSITLVLMYLTLQDNPQGSKHLMPASTPATLEVCIPHNVLILDGLGEV